MNRHELIERLKPYASESNISYAIQFLSKNDEESVSNDDIGRVYEAVSKSIDHTFSDNNEHPMWSLETDLSKTYLYPSGITPYEVLHGVRRSDKI